MSDSRPNILFLFSDQQRWDTVGCYGDDRTPAMRPDLTPNLDKLAADGVQFRHAFTCQPVCGPARSCLQTGMWATQSGCYRNNIALPLEAPTLAKSLSAAGYETAYVGKWHLASDDEHNFRTKAVPVERRGGYRDYWVASDVLEFTSSGYEGFFYDGDNQRVDWEGYRVERTADFALDYVRQYAAGDRDRPFFLLTSFIEPHHQNDLDRYIGPIGSKRKYADYHVPGDLACFGKEAGDWFRHMPDYLGCCASLDDQVARFRALLEETGLADNTLIIYTSDHGSHFCTRNGEYKRSCHESSIRVPMIACGPGFTGGRTVDDLVSLIDLPPTILRTAGVDPLEQMVGRPLHDVVAGSTDWPDDVFAQISESQCGRTVRTHRWKYGVTSPRVEGERPPAASDRYVEQYLYDLDADPYETNDLVKDPQHAAVREEMADRLRKRLKAAGEVEAVIEPSS